MIERIGSDVDGAGARPSRCLARAGAGAALAHHRDRDERSDPRSASALRPGSCRSKPATSKPGSSAGSTCRRADPRRLPEHPRGRQAGAGRPPRNRNEYRVAARDTGGAGDGEIVVAEAARRAAGSARREPGSSNGWVPPRDPGAISLLAIAAYDIPTEFPAAALAEAEAAKPVSPAGRSRSARHPAGHDRRQRRPRFRRRGLGRARPRPGESAAAGTSSSRSPTSPGMCGPAARSTARPSGAATRSIFPTASCRCCPRRCRTSCAR